MRPIGDLSPAGGVSWTLDPAPRPRVMSGTMRADQLRDGVPRGPFGLSQRRVRPGVFGEPAFEAELVPESVCPARPHVLAWLAWRAMSAAGIKAGVAPALLSIYAGYRSVAFQAQVWEYRLRERAESRVSAGLPPLSQRDLERQQRKWTAKPGQSAHHTGLALDLGLYELGKRESRRSPAYTWLAANARDFGFYPYIPEAWHWEFNPPGLVTALAGFRRALAADAGPNAALTACCRALVDPG